MKMMVDGVFKIVFNLVYGDLSGLGIVLVVFVIILLLIKYGCGLIGNIVVLLGIVIGMFIVMVFGKVSFVGIIEVDWVVVIMLLYFGMLIFYFGVIVLMCIVMLIMLVELIGMFLVLVEIIGKKFFIDDLICGLWVDGFGMVIGGLFNMFLYILFL